MNEEAGWRKHFLRVEAGEEVRKRVGTLGMFGSECLTNNYETKYLLVYERSE